MKFIYKPEGAEPRSWEFAPNRLMSPESEAIEKLTGMTYAEWGDAVGRGSITAIHGLLYVLLKRENPTLAYSAVEFCLDDIDFEVEDDEAADIRTALEERLAAGETLDAEESALLEKVKDVEADPKESPGAHLAPAS